MQREPTSRLRLLLLLQIVLGLASVAHAGSDSGRPWPHLHTSASKILRCPPVEHLSHLSVDEIDGFTIRTAEGGHVQLVLVERSKRLVFARLTIRFGSPRTLGEKLRAYFDPPLVDGVRSGLGNVHRRRVQVRRPAPYAFENRRDETSQGRIVNREIHRASDLVRRLAPGITTGRVRRDRHGAILADPGLDLVVRLITRAILGEPARIVTRRLAIAFDFDESLVAVRIQVASARLDAADRSTLENLADSTRPRWADESARLNSKASRSLRRALADLEVAPPRVRP